jgi:putative heme iron utilization protein
VTTFAPDAVAAICRHMNEDHRADAVLICRHLAGVADVVDAETVAVDGHGMRFAVRASDGGAQEVTVAFAAPVAERAEVRTAVVELYERARAAAGLPPRAH